MIFFVLYRYFFEASMPDSYVSTIMGIIDGIILWGTFAILILHVFPQIGTGIDAIPGII